MSQLTIQTKENIIQLLEGLAVLRAQDKTLQQQFLEGTNDLTLESLGVDSLAVMEICIALEMECGLSVSPDQLLEFGSVLELANFIQEAV